MTSDDKYIDVLITEDGIALDEFGFPILISGRASIAQDLKHMIRETGFLVQMIGERNAKKVRSYMVQIESKVEDDLRIRPGTAKVTRVSNEVLFITATTLEYGDVEFNL